MNERDRFRRAFVLLLLVFISAMFITMIRQFLMTILLAAIFSGLAQPLYKRLVGAFRGRRALASITCLLIILVVIVWPLLFFLGVLTSQAISITTAVGPWIQKQTTQPDRIVELMKQLPLYDQVEPYRAQILTKLGQFVGFVGNFLVQGVSAGTRGTIAFLFHFFIMLYAMFFFLKDGKGFLGKILSYVPLAKSDEDRMVDRFVSVSRYYRSCR